MNLRFILEDIEAGAGDLPGGEGLDQRRLIDDRTAGRIDQKGRRLHAAQGLLIDQMAGSGRQWNVDRDDVRGLEELVKGDVAGGESVETGALIEGTGVGGPLMKACVVVCIIAEGDILTIAVLDLHPKTGGTTGHRMPDPAISNYPEPLSGQTRSEQHLEIPPIEAAGPQKGIRLDDAASGGKNEGKRQVSGRVGEDIRGVGDMNSAAACDFEIDVVEANRHIGNDLQV